MDMEELLAIVGRLYIDLIQSQKTIIDLQKHLTNKDKEIVELQHSITAKSLEQ